MPGTPSLAGQSEIYLSSQLKQFRDGKRHNEVMSVIAKYWLIYSIASKDLRIQVLKIKLLKFNLQKTRGKVHELFRI